MHKHPTNRMLLNSTGKKWFWLLLLLEVDEVYEEAFFYFDWFFVETELQEYLIVDHINVTVAAADTLFFYCLDKTNVLVADNDQLMLG